MKKENVSILLTVILFVVVTFEITMGWIAIKNQGIKFSNLQQKEYSLRGDINYLKSVIGKLGSELANSAKNISSLENTIKFNKISQQELSMRLNQLTKELDKWKSVSDAMISKIEQLDDKIITLKSNRIKSVELGELSVKKNGVHKIEGSTTQ